MGFIKFFCIKPFFIKSSILARENWPRSVFLKPNKLILLEILMPLATAKDTRKDEKLPGPLLTSMEKLVSKFTLYFFMKFNMLATS